MNSWYEDFEGAVTICDPDGIITYMNLTSQRQFLKYGGSDLIGTNLLDCHPEPSRTKLGGLLKSQGTNTYTIEKNGIKKIIHQSPLFEQGIYRGMIEISFLIPDNLPHHIRE
ncbi:MAG: hypothetical protein WCJ95_01565 [Mariniphaga sp.]